MSTLASQTELDSNQDGEPCLTLIRPRPGMRLLDLPELYRYRDLLRLLAKRDVQVRYKQTALGALWAVLQPVGMMVVIATFLGPITGVSDPVTLYAGLLPWTLFAAAVNASSTSLVNSAALLRKVYFPRLILPVASVGAPMLDFAIGAVVFAGLLAWSGIHWTSTFALLPLFALTTVVAALGLGLLASAVAVTYRDFRFVVPFALQLLFFATPVVVKHEQFPTWLAPLLWMNPVGGTIGGFRAIVLDQPIDWAAWVVSSGVALLTLVAGLWYFGHVERRFADIV